MWKLIVGRGRDGSDEAAREGGPPPGANELDDDGRPGKLRHEAWFPVDEGPFDDNRDAYAPLVWQCRYSSVEVPDAPWTYAESGAGVPYADNQAEDMVRERNVRAEFDAWTDAFAAHVRARGKVPPGRRRAYGYTPPPHRMADLRLEWRHTRMRVGLPPEGSSPDVQQRLGLNRDATLHPGRSERTRNTG